MLFNCRSFGFLFGAFAAAGCLLLAAAARAAPPSPEDFAAPPQLADLEVSPSGRRMAVLTVGNAGRRVLAVIDLDPVGESRVVAAFADANINSVHWVNDDRLVFSAFQDGVEIRQWGGGTFAVNHDGSDRQQLIAWAHSTDRVGSNIVSRVLPYGWFYRSALDDGSNDILVYREVRDSRGDLSSVQLARLDTVTRRLSDLSWRMPAGARQWLLDVQRQPRVVTALRDGRYKIYWREPQAESWTEVADFDPLADAGLWPVAVDDDGSILVSTTTADMTALHRFDPRAKRLDPEPLVRVGSYDVLPNLQMDSRTRRVLGLHTVTDRPTSVWFNADLQRLQRAIDAALPKDRVNRLYCGRCESTKFFVIVSSSDRQPGEYYLFDRATSRLERLGHGRPRIDQSTQGRRSLHRVGARDGLILPVYVTHPPAALPDKPLPAVVLVHGGPWKRGASLSWNEEAQFLATRGYRVLEPEFRGSTGYGARHFTAGWKQWGGAMQSDLVDTVHWAAREGLVDASRVCVIGASYGGYAALMAPILHPQAFRCAASFAAVTDIHLMYDIHWSDITEDSRRYGMPTMIGDPVKDERLLAASSPLKRAAEIKIPLLVTHGRLDRRVPIDHWRRFVSAARDSGVAVQSHEYADEGHGFWNPINLADHYHRLERFLEGALGASGVPASPGADSKTNAARP